MKDAHTPQGRNEGDPCRRGHDSNSDPLSLLHNSPHHFFVICNASGNADEPDKSNKESGADQLEIATESL